MNYINSELYESFDRLGLNASYEEIKDWVIAKCEEHEKLLELISKNEFLRNSNESLFIEKTNLLEDVKKLKKEIESLKKTKTTESKTNEQITYN